MAWRRMPANWSSSMQKRGEDCSRAGSSQRPHLPSCGPRTSQQASPSQARCPPSAEGTFPMMPPSHHSPAAETCQQDPDPLHQATRGLVVSQKHTQPPPGITPPPTWVHSLHTGSQPHMRPQPPPGVTASTWGLSPHTGSQPSCGVTAPRNLAATDPTQSPSPDHLPGSLLPPASIK